MSGDTKSVVTIEVQNLSDKTQSFISSNEKPAHSESVGESWTNIWGVSPGVGAVNGSTDFNITEEFFAVCGMEESALADGLKVTVSDYESVILDAREEKATEPFLGIGDDGAVFIDKKIGELKKDRSFGIKTGSYDGGKYADSRSIATDHLFLLKPGK